MAIVRGQDYAVAIVCDGVGEFAESGAVAERAVAEATDVMRCGSAAAELETVLFEVNDRLQQGAGGATTIVAVSASGDGAVSYAYCGNGALLEIAGMPLGNGRVRLVTANHLLPHVSMARGRETLVSFVPLPQSAFAVSSGGVHIPGGEARLFLACSDGIFSEEDRREGEVDGTVWREVPHPLAFLLEGLSSQWTVLCDPKGDGDHLLEAVLQEALDRLAVDGRLDDDASVAALLVRPASVSAPPHAPAPSRRRPASTTPRTPESERSGGGAPAQALPTSIVVRPKKRWPGRHSR